MADRKPRKLKSKSSSPHDVTLAKHWCVKGMYLKEPRLLPTRAIDSHGLFAVVTQKTSWVHEMLSGKKSDPAARSQITLLLQAMKDEKDVASRPPSSPEDRRPAKGNLQTEELGLSDDEEIEDNETEEEDDQNHRKGKRPTTSFRQQMKSAFAVCEASVNGFRIKFAYSGRQYYLEATQDNLDSFLKGASSFKESEIADRKAKREANAEDSHSPDGASKAAVRWLPCKKRYIINYADEQGINRTLSSNLTPRTQNKVGTMLMEEEYKMELKRVRQKAVNLWNEMDRSKRPRMRID